MPRPISATISLPSLHHNLVATAAQLNINTTQTPGRDLTPRIWAVVKADAYGHGIRNTVKAFGEADGLAMLDLNEAVVCREAGWSKPILLLEGFFTPSDLKEVAHYGLTATVHNFEQIAMLENVAAPARPYNVFVKLNTGMNRLGFAPGDYRGAYARIEKLRQSRVIASAGKMTHFARADDSTEVTDEQVRIFNEVTSGLAGADSVCNSAGVFTPGRWQSVTSGSPQWVRPGICLYGASPFAERSAQSMGLLPAMTLRTELICVRDIPAGAGVGYGHVFTAATPMRIGVVACGYADGYPRHAPIGTPVVVAGVRTRLLGRVSMDMLSVDLDAVPQARVGSPVVLWGEGGPSVDEVARSAGTIGYELLCAVAPRVPKIVV